ncbi:ParB/RepB/Spo0J family partition protein [Dermatobacter hominis]|uniref:ParB/RepB/Spo0J family partition protein n=1 Tax=Dermatobacter hominis TaxID=2884263 RepID=UPI001D100BED|nr:ParB/RepB/Spo0J family partition protein [Dermatobacter hominis]UDY34351.1 ParB/RepB/Spo0J family partition protein [Dermatobacter hominis]
MARKGGLGRGLTSLIPAGAGEDTDTVTSAGLTEVPVESIRPNPMQPRRSFDEESLEGLSDSIKELGVLQPVLVRELDDGYELIAGERRLRAAKRAGLRSVPVVVRTADDVSSLEQALVENLHRQDLNPLEEAAAYQQLIEDFSYTQEQVAQRVGRSRSAVTNLLRLFQLPPGVQRLVGEQLISAGHAKALLGHPDRAYQEALAKRTVAEALSVRDVEQLVRERLELEAGLDAEPDVDTADDGSGPAGGSPGPSPAPLRPPGLLELEELLADHLDTRVSITMTAKRGKVLVEFANLEDLERIYRRIIG